MSDVLPTRPAAAPGAPEEGARMLDCLVSFPPIHFTLLHKLWGTSTDVFTPAWQPSVVVGCAVRHASAVLTVLIAATAADAFAQ